MVPCDEYCDGDLVAVPGGYNVNLNLTEVKMTVMDTNGNWSTYVRDGNNYLFNDRHIAIIDLCPTVPALNGLRIELEGIYTDEYGNFQIFVPSGSY